MLVVAILSGTISSASAQSAPPPVGVPMDGRALQSFTRASLALNWPPPANRARADVQPASIAASRGATRPSTFVTTMASAVAASSEASRKAAPGKP